jgi:hypothetical protein
MQAPISYRLIYPLLLWSLTILFGAVFTFIGLSIGIYPDVMSDTGSIFFLILIFGGVYSIPALALVYVTYLLMIRKTHNVPLVRWVIWLVTLLSILITLATLGTEFIGEFAWAFVLGLSIAVLIISPKKKS